MSGGAAAVEEDDEIVRSQGGEEGEVYQRDDVPGQEEGADSLQELVHGGVTEGTSLKFGHACFWDALVMVQRGRGRFDEADRVFEN